MKRALVLSGGGPVGIAWETGILAGLEREGLDLGEADLIVGTSAGSVVGAQRALGRSAKELLDGLQKPAAAREPDEGSKARSARGFGGLIEVLARPRDPSCPPEQIRSEVGAFAEAAATPAEDVFLAALGESWGLVAQPWPARFVCTSVDTQDGAFRVWDRDAGVELHRAVAASCAVPGIFPPIAIQGRRHMDGGIRSVTSADLATGHDLVVVIALAAGPMSAFVRPSLEREVAGLEKDGARVVAVIPDAGCVEAMGPNPMDQRRSKQVADAGGRQGREEFTRLKDFWVGQG